VVKGVVEAVRSPRVFDRNRGLAALRHLLESHVNEAVRAARTLTGADDVGVTERQRAVSFLAAGGDRAQLEIALRLVGAREDSNL